MTKLMAFANSLGAETTLTRDQMKQVKGGVAPQVYHCTCEGGTGGAWNYTNGEPSNSVISQDIQEYCSSGAANCGWATCGNPGVTC